MNNVSSISELVHVLDCPYCKFRSLRIETIKDHITDMHHQQPKQLIVFSCPLCFAKTTDMHLLNDHKMIYHDEFVSQHHVNSLVLPQIKENGDHSTPHTNVSLGKRKTSNEIESKSNAAQAKKTKKTAETASRIETVRRQSSSQGTSDEEVVHFSPRKTRLCSAASESYLSSTNSDKSKKPVPKLEKPALKRSSKDKGGFKIHPDVYKRMKELWRMGTHNPFYLRNFLRTFVERDLIIANPVRKTDTTYFPTIGMIKNCLTKWPNDFPPPLNGQLMTSRVITGNNSKQITLSNRRGVVGGSHQIQRHKSSMSSMKKKKSLRVVLKSINKQKSPAKSQLSVVLEDVVKNSNHTEVVSPPETTVQNSNQPNVETPPSEPIVQSFNSILANSDSGNPTGLKIVGHMDRQKSSVKLELNPACLTSSASHNVVLDSPTKITQPIEMKPEIVAKTEQSSSAVNNCSVVEIYPQTPQILSVYSGNSMSIMNVESSPVCGGAEAPIEVEDDSYLCPLCFGEFSDMYELKAHRSEVHPFNV